MNAKCKMGALVMILLVLPAIVRAEPVGRITNMEGSADITSPGTPARMAALNATVSAGDFVRTKSKSRVEITFQDGNILRLAESSRVGITRYAADKNQSASVINLFRGKIYNMVNVLGRGKSYEVHTPTAVSGVRGTQFFNYYINGVSAAVFEKGSGYAYNKTMPDKVSVVHPGQGVFVAAGQASPVLRSVTPNEMNELQSATQMRAPGEKATSEEQTKPAAVASSTTIIQEMTLASATSVDQTATQPPTPSEPTPVIVEPPHPRPVVYPPHISLAITGQEVGFSHRMDNGSFTGSGASAADGVLFSVSASGTYTGTPLDPAGGMVNGTIGIANVANAGISGYVMGLPSPDGSSWRSLTSAIYVNTDGQAGFILGGAEGTFNNGLYTGNGGLLQRAAEFRTTATAVPLTLAPWTDVSLPVFANAVFNADGSVSLNCSGATCQSEIRGIDGAKLDDGRPLKIGVGGALSTGGYFSNPAAMTEYANKKVYGHESAFQSAYFTENLSARIDEVKRRVHMTATFEYMNTLYVGKLAGEHVGSYDAANHYSGVTRYAAGMMPIAQVNELGTMPGVGGLMGSTESIWSNPAIPLTCMGRFNATSGFTSGVWESRNYAGGGYLTNDGGGAYKGFHLAQKVSGGISLDHLGLYVDANGNAGILHGNSETGPDYYNPPTGEFIARGGSKKTELAKATGVSAADFVQTGTSSETFSLEDQQTMPTVFGSLEACGINNVKYFVIGRMNLTGTYQGANPGAAAFDSYHLMSGGGIIGAQGLVFTQLGTDYTPSLGGGLFGNITGSLADWQSAFTAVYGGHVKGTYDPSDVGTWSATGLMSLVKTPEFISLAQTDAGRAKLADLNIPYARVGTVTLSGSDANASIAINDIGFYAYSTGAKPQIWASGNVAGSYTAAPGTGATTYLTGAGGFEANFVMQKWGGTPANTWGANIVNGTGGFNGSTVFKGSATGNINGLSITGTASGVAQ